MTTHDGAVKMLNVGCGPHHIRVGWVNMDLKVAPGIVNRDATQPFDDLGPFSHVYSEHFLEHLTLDGAVAFLKNSLSALVPGGRIRLTTPGLEWVWMTHFNIDEKNEERIIDRSYAANRAFRGWGHQFLWTKTLLQKALESVGFVDVRFWRDKESDDPGFQGVERRGGWVESRGIPNYWIVEGLRPDHPEDNTSRFLAEAEDRFLKYVRAGA